MSLLKYCRDEGQKSVIRLYESGLKSCEIGKLLNRQDSSIRRTIRRIKGIANQQRPNVSEVYKPPKYTQPLPKPLLRPAAAPEAQKPNGKPETILFIPDLHQCPNHPYRLDVLKWIARFGSERRFGRVIQGGDWLSWDSVSRHDKNDTYKGRCKPKIQQDMDHLHLSLQTWLDAKDKDWKPKQEFCEGNHEYRTHHFENANPELYGFVHTQMIEAYSQYGWRFHNYGEPIYIQDVGFVHHLNNGMGKAFGGKTGAQRAGNEAVNSFVVGHTHSLVLANAAKLGLKSGIRIIEAGCALPWGEIEHYALHSLNNWWWGVLVITVHGGEITDVEAVSMLTLEDRYGD